ncbi:MAG TPA: amidase [Chloroflexota bacterium]|jgi:aspartyl-tRNA(Asn)/glutamyl-tRNA(Gln) amidotransferase subunit A
MSADTIARRLAFLEGIDLAPSEIEAIRAELAEYEHALAALEPFANESAWLVAQAQPYHGAPPQPEGGRPPQPPNHGGSPGAARTGVAGSGGQAEVTELWQLGAAALGRKLKAREVSSVEVTDAVLTRLERLEGRLNAFVTIIAEHARAAAQQADAEIARGEYRGPLHGVPVTIKDMFNTAGVRTTGGSKILAGWVPDEDATLVERLHAAGAVLVGKTNLDEFGHGGTSTLSHFGPVHNPWNLERIAGGSSGGSAAAVAAGIGPLSYGTETGSSVRRPASYCGIVGYRPTFGIISRCGSFRGAWSMDTIGDFARSVEDAALGLDATAGYDSRDPASVPQDPPAYAARLRPDARGLRIGVLRRFADDASVEPAVRAAFEAAVAQYRELGAEVRDLDVPEISYAAMTSMMNSAAESAGNNRTWVYSRAGDYVPDVKRRLAMGMGITASEYLVVQRARHRIQGAVRAAFDTIDLMLAPTTARPAPPIAQGPRGNGDTTYAVSHNLSNLLRLASMLGLPACSLPSGFTPDGLPTAIQLFGVWYADQTVLNAAAAYEQTTPWSTRRPAIA